MRMFVLENVDMASFHGVITTTSSKGPHMSTSLLYHRFGIVGYHYVRQLFEPGITTFYIEQPRERLRCSHCHSEDVWAQGGVERDFRALPIGGQPSFIHLKVPRVLCFCCGKVRQVKIPFADPKKHYTHAFER